MEPAQTTTVPLKMVLLEAQLATFVLFLPLFAAMEPPILIIVKILVIMLNLMAHALKEVLLGPIVAVSIINTKQLTRHTPDT